VKPSVLVPIALGFAIGHLVRSALEGAARERQRAEEIHGLERELLEAAVAELRAPVEHRQVEES